MSLVQPIALFLSLYRYVSAPDAAIKFPGIYQNFIYSFTPSSQDIIARSELYLSVEKPDQVQNEAFNIADNPTPQPWSIIWPMMCEYFGLKSIPASVDDQEWKDIDKWWFDHLDDYQKMCDEYGLQKRGISGESWTFSKVVFTLLERDRGLCLDKFKSVGFTEEYSVGSGYIRAFDHLKREKIVPGKW